MFRKLITLYVLQQILEAAQVGFAAWSATCSSCCAKALVPRIAALCANLQVLVEAGLVAAYAEQSTQTSAEQSVLGSASTLPPII